MRLGFMQIFNCRPHNLYIKTRPDAYYKRWRHKSFFEIILFSPSAQVLEQLDVDHFLLVLRQLEKWKDESEERAKIKKKREREIESQSNVKGEKEIKAKREGETSKKKRLRNKCKSRLRNKGKISGNDREKESMEKQEQI